VGDRQDSLVGHIWAIADLLRSDFRASEYGWVILPLVVLRRIDCERQLGIFPSAASLAGAEGSADQLKLADQLRRSISALPQATADLFQNFGFEQQISRLDERNLLAPVIRSVGDLDLSVPALPIDQMVNVFGELVSRLVASANETVGDHSTPADVNALLAELLILPGDRTGSEPSALARLYDPVCGTGGTLAAVGGRISALGHTGTLELYGQEVNAQFHAIARSMLLLSEADPNRISLGNTLSNDQHAGATFEYLVAHPPFGVEWRVSQDAVENEAETRGFAGRFGAGLPRINDGSLLFVQHLIAHMRPAAKGGSRLAVILNGSPMFHGSAGSGESEIRRWILENDLLEGIIALPERLFSNTSIPAFIWVISNRKASSTRGKVVFLDARRLSATLRSPLGEKRVYLTAQQITDITRNYASALEDSVTEADSLPIRRLDVSDFGYQSILIERPLKLRFEMTPEIVTQVEAHRAVKGWFGGGPLGAALRTLVGRTWSARSGFEGALGAAVRTAGGINPLPVAVRRAVVNAASITDETGEVQLNQSGAVLPNPDLRSWEKLPLGQDVEAFLRQQILNEHSDAWVDESKSRIGYEVPQSLFLTPTWGDGFGPLRRVAHKIQSRVLSKSERFGVPFLTGRTLFATDTAADLLDTAEESRLPLVSCTGGDLVGAVSNWRLLPADFGDALTTLTVLRPKGHSGKTLEEWLRSGHVYQHGLPSHVSMDMPVPIDVITDPEFGPMIDDLAKGRANIRATTAKLLPNVFHVPVIELVQLRRTVRDAATEAQLIGELIRPLDDPVWRAELTYPFPVASLARHYRIASTPASRKEALLKLGESIARSVGVMCLAIMYQRHGQFSADLHRSFRTGATFGTWNRIIKDLRSAGEVSELPELNGVLDPNGVHALLEKIRKVRNREGHAFGISAPHEVKEEIGQLEPLVVAALEATTWLSNVPWELVEECRYTGSDFEVSGKRLRGSHQEWEPVDRPEVKGLAPHRIYAQSPATADPVCLWPIATAVVCPVCHNLDLFLINQISDGNITLRSRNDHETFHPEP
jgi:type I restriction enzyme M protein